MSFLARKALQELTPKLEDPSKLEKTQTSESLSNLMHRWILPQLSSLIRMFELIPQTTLHRMPNHQPNPNLGELLEELKHNQSIPNPIALLAWSKLMHSCYHADESNPGLVGHFDLGPNGPLNFETKTCPNEDTVLDLTQKPTDFINCKQEPMNVGSRMVLDLNQQCQDFPRWLLEIGQGGRLENPNPSLDPSVLDCATGFSTSYSCCKKDFDIGCLPEKEPVNFPYVDGPFCSANFMNSTPSNETYPFADRDRWMNIENPSSFCFSLPDGRPNANSNNSNNNNGDNIGNQLLNIDSIASQSSTHGMLHLPVEASPMQTPGSLPLPPPQQQQQQQQQQQYPPQSFSPPLNFGAFTLDQNMICPICRKCFRFEKNLLRHLQKTHATGTGESVLKCKLCNYTTRHYSNMYVHIRTHTGDKPYSCSACGVSFTQGSSLKLHIKSRHNDNGNYFSLTRKPGKNNLTKLWTRVLKKDLPKFTSMKTNPLIMNFTSPIDSYWNEWNQGGQSISNSMNTTTTMMMMMMMQQSKRIPTNQQNSINFSNMNSMELADCSHHVSSKKLKLSIDLLHTGDSKDSNQNNHEMNQTQILPVSPSTSLSSPTHPPFVFHGSNKQRKYGPRLNESWPNSFIQRIALPWKRLNQTKKSDRASMKYQQSATETPNYASNDSSKQDLPSSMDHDFSSEQREIQIGPSSANAFIKQEEYYNASDCQEQRNMQLEFNNKPLDDAYSSASNSMNMEQHCPTQMISGQIEHTRYTQLNQNVEKYLPFSIAAIQPR